MLLRAVPSPKPLSTGMSPRRSGRLQNLNWLAVLNRNGRQDHHPDNLQGQEPPDRLSALDPVHREARGTSPSDLPEPNDRVRPHDREPDQDVRPAQVATHSNSSASRSAGTAAAQGVMLAAQGGNAPEQAATVQPCRLACANRSPPVSSCSCRNQPDDQRPPRRGDPMEHPSAPEQTGLRRPHRYHGQPRHHRHRRQHQGDPVDSDRARVRVDNGGLAVPTGTTVPSSRPCATVHRRSNARKFTSSARTMIPWQHRPGASPVSRKIWSCRPALRDRPSRNPRKKPHPSRLRPCASGARKPPGNASAVGPWNCVLPGKPSRSDRK